MMKAFFIIILKLKMCKNKFQVLNVRLINYDYKIKLVITTKKKKIMRFYCLFQ